MPIQSLLDETLEAWAYTRSGFISEIQNLSEADLKMRPHAESRTATELAIHIAESGLMMSGELSRPDGNFQRKTYPQFIKEYGGKRHAFCSDACEGFFDQEPHRYLGYSTFYELFDGYDLADYIIENGLLRADGKTLIAQPWLDMERMWNIDDIRACRYEIRNPLRNGE